MKKLFYLNQIQTQSQIGSAFMEHNQRNQAKKQNLSGEARPGKSPTPRHKSTKGVEVDLTNQRALSKKKSGNNIDSHVDRDNSMLSQNSANPHKAHIGLLGSGRTGNHDAKLSDIDLTGAIDTGVGVRNAASDIPVGELHGVRTKSPVDSDSQIQGFGGGILAISNNMCDNSEQNSPSALNRADEPPSFSMNMPLRPPQIQNFASSDGMNNFSQTMNQQALANTQNNNQQLSYHQKTLSAQNTQNTLNYFSNLIQMNQAGQNPGQQQATNLQQLLANQNSTGSDLNADLQSSIIKAAKDPNLNPASMGMSQGRPAKTTSHFGTGFSSNNVTSTESYTNPSHYQQTSQNSQPSATKGGSRKMKKVPSKGKLATGDKKGKADTSDNMRGASHNARSQGKSQTRATSQNTRLSQQAQEQINQEQIAQQMQMQQMLGLQQFTDQPSGTTQQPQNYNGFSFITPNMSQTSSPFQFAALSQTQQQQILQQAGLMQPQPQVHFIAKQQKFYGISPDRAPLIFNNQNNEKRPYTSSGGQILNKRMQESKKAQHSSAIAALYLGQKQTSNNSGGTQQVRNMSQPSQQDNSYTALQQQLQQAANSMNQLAPPKTANIVSGSGSSGIKRQTLIPKTSNSATIGRKQQVLHSHQTHALGSIQNQKEIETLVDENFKMKQMANKHRDENTKLKTKVKILENEVIRKERVIEDVLQQSQFIQNQQKNAIAGGNLAPIVQTAQKYQQETFLVMSLKKQVKEMKQDLLKKDELILTSKKNMKHTRTYELEQEIRVYKDELVRLRFLCEQVLAPSSASEKDTKSRQDSIHNLGKPTTNGSLAFAGGSGQMSQPVFNQSETDANEKLTSSSKMTNSQKNFYQKTDAVANIQSAWMTSGQNFNSSKQPTMTQTQSYNIGQTISNEDTSSQNEASQLTHITGTNGPQLPPLSKNTILNKHLQNTTGASHLNSILTTPQIGGKVHLPSDETPVNQFNSYNMTSLGPQTTVDDSQLQQLLHQLADRDSQIALLGQQLDEVRQQQVNSQQARQSTQPDKERMGTAEKKELSKLRKQIRDKEKEITKLKTDNSVLSTVKQTKEEDTEKKLKQLSSQVATQKKKTTDLQGEIKRRDEQIDNLTKDIQAKEDKKKQQIEKHRREQHESEIKLEAKVQELMGVVEKITLERDSLKTTAEVKQTAPAAKAKKQDSPVKASAPKEKSPEKAAPAPKSQPVNETSDEELLKILGEKEEGELCLVATVVGCREFKDRIEFAMYLKDYVNLSDKHKAKSDLDFKLTLSERVIEFIKKASMDRLALTLPKYDLITPQLAVMIMKELRSMLCHKELLEVLTEKENETSLPFDALRDLCLRFATPLNDEQCAFVTASYFNEIDTGVIYINFKEFLQELRDSAASKYDIEMLRQQRGASISESIGSDDSKESLELRKAARAASLSDAINRSGSKAGKLARGDRKKSMDEEYMLDVAEAIFVKLAELMVEKGRSVRGIFTKYSTPELITERNIVELLSPIGFLEGLKETGLRELQEFEMACVMRVLAKPELDSHIVLNELVVIMENFGVMDQMEEDDVDEYIPDTETESSVIQDKPDGEEAAKEKASKEESKEKTQEGSKKESKDKKSKRTYDLKNVGSKGVKILRKLARFLLKQFLHPREFFGKSIVKENIKTKKREFQVDVLKVKDFYLKIKIANIRKRLTEDESLNNELCLDKKNFKHFFHVKFLVKALEEIAEEEQVKLMAEEQEEAKTLADSKQHNKSSNNLSEPDTPRSDDESAKGPSEDYGIKASSAGGKKEKKDKSSKGGPPDLSMMNKFSNGKADGVGTKSPMMKGVFVQLNTIEEERYETHTSNYGESQRDDSKMLNSNHLKSSQNLLEAESERAGVSLKSPDMMCGSLGKDSNLSQHLPDVDNKSDLMASGRNIEGKLDHMAGDKFVSKSLIESSIENINEDAIKLDSSQERWKHRNNHRHSATDVVRETNKGPAGLEESIEEDFQDIDDLEVPNYNTAGAGATAAIEKPDNQSKDDGAQKEPKQDDIIDDEVDTPRDN